MLGEVGLEDIRRVKTVAVSWTCTTSSTSSLRGGCFADPRYIKALYVTALIVGSLFRHAAVNDISDIGNSERCFGDVCSHDYETMTFRRSLEDTHLLVSRQERVQREDVHWG